LVDSSGSIDPEVQIHYNQILMKTRALSLAVLSLSLALGGCFSKQETTHPQFGKELWVGVAALSGTKDPTINGAAIGHAFLDGTFVETIQLNIDPAPKGKDYGVWLLQQSTDAPIFLGFLSSATNDVRHGLTYKGKENPRTYKTVSVTLQDIGKHTAPGTEIAKGTVNVSKDEAK
jgi:hypothetical protein